MFPQKTKSVRHGNVTYLDEFEQQDADFVQVHLHLVALMLPC